MGAWRGVAWTQQGVVLTGRYYRGPGCGAMWEGRGVAWARETRCRKPEPNVQTTQTDPVERRRVT